MTVVAYIRTDEMCPSEAEQTKTIESFCLKNNHEIDLIFIDSNSNEDDKQPNFLEAIKHCTQNSIQTLIMFDYKILARKPIQRVKNSKALFANNIKILFIS